MTVYDLNRDQLIELKVQYWMGTHDEDEEPDYYTLANIDEIVSDEEVKRFYEGYHFSMDDFSSATGQDEPDENSRFFIADSKNSIVYYLYAVNSIEYQWSDWAASTFSKRGAQDALAWARKNGYRNAKAIAIID